MNCMCGEQATHILNDLFICKDCLVKKLDSPLKAKIVPLGFIQRVKERVCSAFEITEEQFNSRSKKYVDPRISMAYILHERGVTVRLISKILNRTISSVSGMHKTYTCLYKTDKLFKQKNDAIWI